MLGEGAALLLLGGGAGRLGAGSPRDSMGPTTLLQAAAAQTSIATLSQELLQSVLEVTDLHKHVRFMPMLMRPKAEQASSVHGACQSLDRAIKVEEGRYPPNQRHEIICLWRHKIQ